MKLVKINGKLYRLRQNGKNSGWVEAAMWLDIPHKEKDGACPICRIFNGAAYDLNEEGSWLHAQIHLFKNRSGKIHVNGVRLDPKHAQ